MNNIIIYLPFVLIAIVVFSSFLSVTQGSIAVITLFGKYRRVLHPGLRMKIPIFEKVYKHISVQNQSIDSCASQL